MKSYRVGEGSGNVVSVMMETKITLSANQRRVEVKFISLVVGEGSCDVIRSGGG